MIDDPRLDSRCECSPDESGSADATAQLFRDEQLSLTRFAFLLTGSNSVAEELVQDAFEQVVRRGGEIRSPGGYLRSAVVSGARSWGRRQHRWRRLDPPGPVVLDEEAVAVRARLACLPHAQREVIVLRYFVGLTDTQIASQLDAPLGTVKSNIRRGLTEMRKAFTP